MVQTKVIPESLKICWVSVRPTRSTLFGYCPVYLVTKICNLKKLISHKAKWMDCQFQDRKWAKTYRLKFWDFYPCLSDTIKYSLERSKPGSSRLTLNLLIIQVSPFDVSIIQHFHDCVKFFIWPKSIDCPSNTFFNVVTAPNFVTAPGAIVYSLKRVGVATECINDHDTNKRNNCRSD